MADFETYQEYQRIEDYDEDSPPGEEDLLIHVPESRGGTYVLLLLVCSLLCVSACACYSGSYDVLDLTFPSFFNIFTLQIHGIISRTSTISSQEYPLAVKQDIWCFVVSCNKILY